ncbi:MAG TPA: putative toxin-antitoxin system toxin component, PIN family [Flavobacteriaceae bacterium]|nr:putative toxin-antitoxin system toxin component, PIN family [Flavobacteriaceae bacterium]
MESKRTILDTNLWISFLISKNFSNIDGPIKRKEILLIFSEELLEEFIHVVNRPKFKKLFSKRDIENILNTFNEYGDFQFKTLSGRER